MPAAFSTPWMVRRVDRPGRLRLHCFVHAPAIAAEPVRPFALFWHGLGALPAFEVAGLMPLPLPLPLTVLSAQRRPCVRAMPDPPGATGSQQ